MFAAQDSAVYVKLPPDVRQKLKLLAKKDDRTLNSYLRVVLTRHVEQLQPVKPSGEPEPARGAEDVSDLLENWVDEE